MPPFKSAATVTTRPPCYLPRAACFSRWVGRRDPLALPPGTPDRDQDGGVRSALFIRTKGACVNCPTDAEPARLDSGYRSFLARPPDRVLNR